MSELEPALQTALAGAYTVQQELGGGGMSRVFVAVELALGRTVVLKVLPPEVAAGVNADRFRREIQVAASMQHPHIVPLLSAGQASGLFYYVMPLVEGESLRTRLSRAGELPVPDAVRILRDVADALTYAHGRGVVHRDIKPDNVLVSGSHALVTDFGVAKALTESSGAGGTTTAGVALGTPAYMAPEQASADPRATEPLARLSVPEWLTVALTRARHQDGAVPPAMAGERARSRLKPPPSCQSLQVGTVRGPCVTSGTRARDRTGPKIETAVCQVELDRRVPKELEGYAVEVQETGPIRAR